MTARSSLGRPIALAAVYIERYGISLVFFFLAIQQLHKVLALVNAAHSGSESFPIADIIRQLIWIQLYLYSGILLLLGRRVTALPQRLEDILLPLGTTFFYLAYYAIPWLPGSLKNSLLPANWQTPFLVTGLILNLIGLWIAIWAAIYLGRSFGVLIEVRTVVLEGAYKWMRHPMYSGYLCFLAGLVMTNFSVAFLVLVPLHILLLLYRAHLEEERLSACSPEYAEHRKRTGFVFPKFGQD